MSAHFLRDDDLTPAEQADVLTLALELKAARAAGEAHLRPLASAALGPRPVALLTSMSMPAASAARSCSSRSTHRDGRKRSNDMLRPGAASTA